MAIFHLTAKVISKGKGQSAIAAAAYRSGEKLRDELAGEDKHYTARSQRIQFTGVFAPKDAPEWAHDRNALWNAVEQRETHGQGVKPDKAQLAREIEIALPHELTDQQREWLVKDFVREEFTRKGFAADVAIHAPDRDSDARNYHAHIMVALRTIDADGFSPTKDRSQNSTAQLKEWREDWEQLCNRHLERHGHAQRIDSRSLEAQGIEREPQIHVGYAGYGMEERQETPESTARLVRNAFSAGSREINYPAIDEGSRFAFNQAIIVRNADHESEADKRRVSQEAQEWSESAGMVAQQSAALDWAKKSSKAVSGKLTFFEEREQSPAQNHELER